MKKPPIRKKIMLSILIPLMLFYFLMTLACLYFSFYLLLSEMRKKHVQESLYTSAFIDENIRELISIGESLQQILSLNNNFNKSNIAKFLTIKTKNNTAILGFGIKSYYEMKEKKAIYWSYNGKDTLKSDYNEHVKHSLKNEISTILNNKNKQLNWVTNKEPTHLDEFVITLLVPVISNTISYIINIDIDGDKLCSCFNATNNHLVDIIPSCVGNNLHNASSSNQKKTGNVYFSPYFTLRDNKGTTIYTKGKSARKHRILNEQIKNMPPIELISNFFTYQEINNINFFNFFYKNKMKKLQHYNPNTLFINILNKVCFQKQFFYYRFSIGKNTYWATAIPLKSADFMLTTYMLEDDIIKPVYSHLMTCFLLTLLAVGIATFLLWRLLGRIVLPIRELNNKVNCYVSSIEPNALSSTLKSTKCNYNEVDNLEASFERLIDSLDEKGQELYDARVNNISFLFSQLSGNYFCFNLNCKGFITYASKSIESILGYKKNEFIGLFKNYLYDENGKDLFNKRIKNVMSSQCNEPFEIRLRHRNGSFRCVEIFLFLMPGIKLGQQVIEGLVNDVTERVNDTEKFKSLIASAPDAVIITNINGIINLVNNKVSELFGYDANDLISMPVDIFFLPTAKYKVPLLEEVDITKSSYQPIEGYESICVKKSGEKFSVEISSSLITTNRESLISIVVRDISERKTIEKEIINQKEKAESSDKAKTLFLSNMSHELRTPLNGVLGYAQILLNDLYLSDFYKEKVKSIAACGGHLLNLINNILDIAKLENDKIYIDKKPFNLFSIINEVQLMTANFSKEKGLLFQCVIDNKVPEYVVGDKLKLRQVLLNLINNAVKFTKKGGISIRVSSEKNKVCFFIEDSGIGICNEDQKKLFVSFTQLEEGRKQGGAGLGLALSYSLVKAMGGLLQVDSQKDIGSCFYFSLAFPLPTGLSIPKEPAYSGLNQEQQKSINKNISLIILQDKNIDDHTLANIFSNSNFNFIQVNSIKEAIAHCKQDLFDLLIVDLLVGHNGQEIIRSLRNALPDRLLNKLFIITDNAQLLVKNNNTACFCCYIEKPFNVNDLFLKIYRCLNNSSKPPSLIEQNKTVYDPTVSLDIIDDIIKQVDAKLEIGDIDGITSLALHWKTIKAYGRYPNDLLDLCKHYDTEALEIFIKTLKAYHAEHNKPQQDLS